MATTLPWLLSQLFTPSRPPKSGRSGWVENRVRLLILIGTGVALEPVDVGAGVEHHVERLRRSADSYPGEVLAAALANTGDDGGEEVLGLDLGVHGLEIPPFIPWSASWSLVWSEFTRVESRPSLVRVRDL
ncbi:hypothetical protein DVH24_021686 [Malus domestica]|uniref:Uncharacterized protein n=1 Tax=Malus domestica TaxID=3750 RepID=A0A498K1T4_MALDO|nr:hypothetical protein DVH24_021686 [Malus domestica]